MQINFCHLAVKLFSHLLEVPRDSLVSCLTTRKIVTAKETCSIPLNVETVRLFNILKRYGIGWILKSEFLCKTVTYLEVIDQ